MRSKTLVAVFALVAGSALASSDVHWTYEGHGGPQDWGTLKTEWGLCGFGHEQSPIDFTGAIEAEIASISLAWNAADAEILNNGHTIQVQGKGLGTATIDGVSYELLQFHFHTPSEHTVDGKHFPMEVHFVHKNAQGGLAVIGVMMEGGGSNDLFHSIMSLAPKEEAKAPAGLLDPHGLITSLDHIYRYHGSLTTPPCAETVLWTVSKTPVKVSDADLEAFRALFQMNARPIQPINRRFLLTD